MTRRQAPRRAAGILLAAATGLAACAVPPPEQTPPASETEAATAPAAPETARKPPPTPKPRSYPEPAALADLAEPKVREILGEPGFVRRDPPAEIWQYRTAGCVLHLFFYEDGENGLALRHLEARKPEGGTLEAGGCIQQVIDARLGPPRTG